MDVTDFDQNVFDKFDVLGKVKCFKNVSLNLECPLSSPIMDLDIDLIDEKFQIKRDSFVDILENIIFDCYGDIIKNYYCTFEQGDFAKSIYIKADNLVMEARRVKLLRFLKQFKSDINLSISFFYKVAETYNATVRPENLISCPQMLQNKPEVSQPQHQHQHQQDKFSGIPTFEYPKSGNVNDILNNKNFI
jgi:hypothetical protein